MKIAFIFTDKPDIAQTSADERYASYFELPDTVLAFPDIQEKVIAIGELVGRFTNVSLHISCREIGLKNHPMRQVEAPTRNTEKLLYSYNAACLYFEPDGHKYWLKRVLKIYSPILVSFPSRFPKDKGYFRIEGKQSDPILREYEANMQTLAEHVLNLLNTDSNWAFLYFNSYLWQNSLATLHKKRSRKWAAEDRKQTREAEKLAALEAKRAERLAAAPQPPLTHGAGRAPGARPGVYNGVQMRSQLEIRFAAELDERGIKWVYEGEALSDASYLVDFYLPDLGVWVEVKGRFEARDRQVLPAVAKYLKAERQHRLLVYTGSGKCCVVNPSGFREVERKSFWGELIR